MTPQDFKKARQSLGLSLGALANILDTDASTVRRWEMPPDRRTARSPNPVAAQVMRWMLAGFRPPEWPDGSDPGRAL